MVTHVERIAGTVTDIIKSAQERSKAPGETADYLAEEKFLNGACSLNDDSNEEDQAKFDVSGGTRLVQ